MPQEAPLPRRVATFLDRFRSGVTEADIDSGLRWLLDDLDRPRHDYLLEALANRVIELASKRPTDSTVVDAFTRATSPEPHTTTAYHSRTSAGTNVRIRLRIRCSDGPSLLRF